MTNAIITYFAIQPPDPLQSSRKLGLPPTAANVNALSSARLDQLVSYMVPWVTSVEKLTSCERIILHDRLPDQLRDSYPWIRFEEFPTLSSEVIWVKRCRDWCSYLDRRRDLEYVLFTDINDVAIVLDPFEWHSSLGISADLILVGEEWTIFRDNVWFKSAYGFFPPKIRDFFEHVLPDTAPACAGVWGGKREQALALLKFTVSLMDEYRSYIEVAPTIGWDMVFFNYALQCGEVVDRYAAVKMEDFGPRHHHAGVKIRGRANPLLHDRNSAMKRLTG